MALEELKIAKPYYNVDPVSKTSVSDMLADGYIDESGTLKRRGGLTEWVDLSNDIGMPGYGLFYWPQDDCIIARSGTKAAKIESDGSYAALTGVTFNNAITTFADGNTISGGKWLYMFDGGYPVYTENGTTLTRLGASSGSPSSVKFGCWNTGRFLVASYGTRKFYATDTNPDTGVIENDYFLAAANPLTAETRPDNIDYMGASWEEIQVWGYQGLEPWRADDTFFAPLQGTFAPVGILAPYSVCEANNTIYALCVVDNGLKRAVISMQGRTPQVISLPIEKVLKSYATVTDAIAFMTDNSEYVITFPTEGKTWCYDYKNDTWYPWSYWNQHSGDRDRFLGNHSCSAWGKTYIQSRLDGKIFEYSKSVYQDDGDTISTEWRTGWINRGVSTRSSKLRLKLKRSQGSIAGSEPIMLVKWRDDGNVEWNNERTISLGKIGHYDFIKEIWGLGSYNSRQYSFILTENADLALAQVWEDVEMLQK